MNNRLSSFILFIFGFLSFGSQLYAQEELKNQISLNADDLIPAVFSSNSNDFNLGYRRMKSERKHLRFGLKYFYEEDNRLTVGIKPGIDFKLKSSSKRWRFYYGLDLAFNYSDSYQAERKNYESSLIGFFRIELVLGKHFSISTEPGLFFKLQNIKDYDGSPIDNSNEIFSSGIKNLGVINLNFSF
ncbi:MAG: hypothetical protein P8M66_01820 [Flavobacteriaceae bacterium]|jgi:hypothetical protein|nr:hypothetical protein [Formosa sp.]MDG1373856.1 hypothetical protein [Flavobacteriaceae bacterium]MDG2498233.1 hypothetical protein [Flavobacteriaceae bacterium]